VKTTSFPLTVRVCVNYHHAPLCENHIIFADSVICFCSSLGSCVSNARGVFTLTNIRDTNFSPEINSMIASTQTHGHKCLPDINLMITSTQTHGHQRLPDINLTIITTPQGICRCTPPHNRNIQLYVYSHHDVDNRACNLRYDNRKWAGMHQEEPTSNRQVAALNAVALAGARACTSVSGAPGSTTSRPPFDGVADVFNMLIGCVE
jgi:hypothetical protein